MTQATREHLAGLGLAMAETRMLQAGDRFVRLEGLLSQARSAPSLLAVQALLIDDCETCCGHGVVDIGVDNSDLCQNCNRTGEWGKQR